MVLTATKGLDRSEWLEWRRKGLGSSDAAAVCGLNPYRSPFAVYLEKRGEIDDQEQNLRMWFGTEVESVVAKRFELETGKRLRRRNAILQHSKHPWMLANIDREIVGERAVVELKTTSEFNRDKWPDDDAPDMYKVQVLHQLAVTGYDYGYLAVIIGNGADFQWRKIERDEEMIENLITIEERFWRKHIEAGMPPDPDGTESAAEALKELYKGGIAEPIELPPMADDLIRQYDEAQAALKEAETLKREAQNKLMAIMGDHEVGLMGDRKVTFRTTTRKGYTVQPTTFRSLRIY